MIIKNGKVFTNEGTFEERDLYVEGEYFQKETNDDSIVDAKDCYVIPGLVDVHFHGCVGYDMCDGTKEAIQKLAEYEATNGILAICPATMTIPEADLLKIMSAAKAYEGKTGADLVGINMEGPFISAAKKGAQKEDDIKTPDLAMYRKLQEASGGLIKLVDLAPETDKAMEFIDQVKDEVHISIAHTTADYDTAMTAIRHGADHVTHLYNAMPSFTHRAPGVIGAARDGECYVELICDGVHIHPSCVRATFEMFGDDKIVLISDSMMATGMEDGQYELGGQPVTVVGNRATLTEGGAIAGSATNLMDCMRTAVKEMGIPLYSAVKCATVNPAKSIGIEQKYGSLEEGMYANAVLLDQELNIVSVIQKGQVKWDCKLF